MTKCNRVVEANLGIFKTCLKPIVTFIGKIRADYNQTKRIFTTGEKKIPRSILLMDKKKNEEIRKTCEVRLEENKSSE